jgi:hypothetical protein
MTKLRHEHADTGCWYGVDRDPSAPRVTQLSANDLPRSARDAERAPPCAPCAEGSFVKDLAAELATAAFQLGAWISGRTR